MTKFNKVDCFPPREKCVGISKIKLFYITHQLVFLPFLLENMFIICLNCSKIFKNSILLPCDDTICREHLTDKEVVKQNKIKCKKCNEEFRIKNNTFKSRRKRFSFI